MKHLQNNKLIFIYLFSLALLVTALLTGIFVGSSDVGFSDVINAIFGYDGQSTEASIVRYVRLPRVLAGILCGAALALSGAVIQGVLANKLASPSIIGVNSGAALAVTLCSAMGAVGGWKLSLAAFTGAFITAITVSLGAKKWGASKGTVILMGVALNAFLGAISDTVITLSPEVSIMSNDFKIGDFSQATYAKLIPAALIISVSAIILLTLTNELDIISLGDESSKGLGMNTSAVRFVFLMLTALLAGAAVSVAGLLSFVGLLVPHAVRRIATSRSKHLLPLCIIIGAGFVTLCDTLARVIFAPYEIPVGIIMAFLGAPFFIFILIKGKGAHSSDRA